MTARRPVVRINRPLIQAGPRARRSPRLRVGLLGGSFNPAHEGHRAISEEAIKRLRLDRVCWLVSPKNPLKPSQDMASFADRFASAKRQARHPRLVVSDIEQRLGTRYSLDTIRVLQGDRRTQYIWLIGADNLAQLPRWRGWREVMQRVPVAVFDREPYTHRALAGRRPGPTDMRGGPSRPRRLSPGRTRQPGSFCVFVGTRCRALPSGDDVRGAGGTPV